MDFIIHREEDKSSQLHIGLYKRSSLEGLLYFYKSMKSHSIKEKTGEQENKKARYKL